MKIMFLNAWQATTGEVLWSYIKEQKESSDVFCFMEAGQEFRTKCREILPDYIQISTEKSIVDEEGMFQATYVRSNYKILNSEPILGIDPNVGLGLYTQITNGDKLWNIASIHGVARPGNKLDNPKRLEQSNGIVDFMAKIDGTKLIGGDFNLDKNTESVKMFEKNGYRNLIEEFGIDMTRNHLSWDLHPQKQLWADFLFVTSEVKVKSFEVPKNEVSDHLPLIIEIEE
ncbi:MAG: hypothetical protein WC503_06645 [Candidatus Shapirobacteria bacterium]